MTKAVGKLKEEQLENLLLLVGIISAIVGIYFFIIQSISIAYIMFAITTFIGGYCCNTSIKEIQKKWVKRK